MDRLHALTFELATRLASAESNRLSAEIEGGMAELRSLLEAGRVSWYVKRHDAAALVRMYEVAAPGVSPSPAVVLSEELPYAMPRLMRGDRLAVTRLADLPVEAEQDRRFLQAFSVESLALIPSGSGISNKGVLKVTLSSAHAWPPELVDELEAFGNVIVSTVDRELARTLAQETQEDSDRRFRHVFEQAPLGIAVEDLSGTLLLVNPALCSILGYTSAELIGMSCAQFGHVGDSEDESVLFQQLRAGAIGSYTLDKRYVRKDGVEMWGRLNVSRVDTGHGQPPLVMAMLEDVTERRAAIEELKRAQAESRELTERLIRARDDERARIGRDLHDDISQRVALLAMELARLRDQLSGHTQQEQHQRASDICASLDELGTDLHNLSHALSLSQLRHLGLAAALQDLCARVSSQFRVQIDLSCTIPDGAVSPDLALCMFRVAQEALHNVTSHSQAQRASVDVRSVEGEVWLVVRDVGVGFDPLLKTGGIGLASMRERLRSVGGRLKIDSRPGGGTTIVAALPAEAGV